MENLEELSESIALAFEHIRALHAALSAMMVDTAALRQLIAKDPKTAKLYCQVLASETEKVKPLVATAMKAYDDIIRSLRSREPWKH